MKFIEYLKESQKNEQEFECNIGGVDIPCTTYFDEEAAITDYCIEKYNDLLNSEVKVLSNDDNIDRLEIDCTYSSTVEEFIYAIAGYVGTNEYRRLFGDIV